MKRNRIIIRYGFYHTKSLLGLGIKKKSKKCNWLQRLPQECSQIKNKKKKKKKKNQIDIYKQIKMRRRKMLVLEYKKKKRKEKKRLIRNEKPRRRFSSEKKGFSFCFGILFVLFSTREKRNLTPQNK